MQEKKSSRTHARLLQRKMLAGERASPFKVRCGRLSLTSATLALGGPFLAALETLFAAFDVLSARDLSPGTEGSLGRFLQHGAGA